MSDCSSSLIIQAHNVVCRYPNGVVALNNLSFSVPKGACCAVLGANGAGKSTLLLCLSGLLPIHGGEIVVCGARLCAQKKAPSLLGKVGIVFQDPDDQLLGTTVAEDIELGPRAMRLPDLEAKQRADAALHAMNIAHLSQRRPHQLSLGEKRQVALAGALAMRPELILLDEPTAFLDPASIAILESALARLAAQQVTLLIATHDVDFAARWANQVVLLAHGQALTVDTHQALTNQRLMAKAGLRLPTVAELFANLLPPDVPLPANIQAGRLLLQKLLPPQADSIRSHF